MLCICARLFICALWSPAGKGLTSWLSFVVSNCEFVTFSLVRILSQVWYLVVSIPDLCTLTYFYNILNDIMCVFNKRDPMQNGLILNCIDSWFLNSSSFYNTSLQL